MGFLLAALALVVSLFLAFGPSILQGFLFVVVTAIAASLFGPSAAALAAFLGLVAAHVQLWLTTPAAFQSMALFTSRRYVVGVLVYAFVSGVLIYASDRHFRLLHQLDRERRDKADVDVRHRHELEKSLTREITARQDAEEAMRLKADLLERLDHELRAVRHLAAIVESSDDAIVAKDLEGVVTSWNRAAEKMFGYEAAEMVNRPIRVIIPPDRQAEEDNVLASVRRGDSLVHFETIRRRKDGSLIPVSLTVSPIRGENGRIVGASKIARDISERKHAEAAIADLQHRLIALVAASGALLKSPRVEDVRPAALDLARSLVVADAYALWLVAQETAVWSINTSHGLPARFAAATIRRGDTDDERQAFDRPVIADDVAALERLGAGRAADVAEGIQSMLEIPLVVEGEVAASLAFYFRSRHTFSDVEVETASALGNLTATALTTAALYDRQQRSRAESEFLALAGDALAESLDYETTLQHVAGLAVPVTADWCAVDLVGDEGQIRRVAAAQINSQAWAWRAFEETYAKAPSSPLNVERVIRTAESVLVERLSDGVPPSTPSRDREAGAARPLKVSSAMAVPIVVRGEAIGAMTFVAAESLRHFSHGDLRLCESIATRAGLAIDRARAYAEATRANQLKDEFLATLSHELRTPLNAIVGYATLLRSNMLDRDGEARAFAILDRNAQMLTQIVEDVLDVSRIVSGKVRLQMEPVDLSVIATQAEATVRPAADAKGVSLETTVEHPLPWISGDPGRLQQVVWNLLSNAVKFTATGGSVQVALARKGSSVQMVVSDTGRGISEAFLPHVFERFRQASSGFSRQHGGLGLGLAICRDLVGLHGGTIHAMSAGEGRGATFSVEFPILLEQADRTRPPSSDRRTSAPAVRALRTGRLRGVRVLAVDDEGDALTLLREILEASGATVTCATSADEACAALSAMTPDVIIADIGMPDADGFELIRRVRNGDLRQRNIPAAAVTAYARSEDQARALQAGFQVHLSKPIDPGDLVAAVASLLALTS